MDKYYINLIKSKTQNLVLLYFLILLVGCSGKANLAFSPREVNYQTGKGKGVAVTVQDNRFNKEFCRTSPPAANISLDRSPVTHTSDALKRGLSSLGFSVNQSSSTKIQIEINDFYIAWPAGFNVSLRSEVNLSVSIKNDNKFTLRRKRINSYLTATASGGGFPAVPVAQNLIQRTFNSAIHKIFDDQEIIQNLLENELPATPTPTPTPTIKKTPAKEKSIEPKSVKKEKAAVTPIATIGDIKESQKTIIANKFLDELSDDYDIVPQEEYEKAEEEAFQQLDYEECTEDQCIRLIQEFLQVENIFKLQMIREGKDTQVSLTLVDLDRKLVKTEFCEDCNTSTLIKTVTKLYRALQNKR